jgi:Protein of unknown function (DUF1329)
MSALVILMVWAAPVAQAQISWNEQNYRQFVDASSPKTIPPGTRITVANWEQYKDFLPVGLWAALSGAYQFHVTADPEYAIVVAPTTHFAMPTKWKEDGEKYGGQTRLERTAQGGYIMRNWMAGPPFPNPGGPQQGIEIMYNAWTPLRPFNMHSESDGWLVDRYGNRTQNTSDDSFFQLSHLSEPNMSMNMPYAGGMFYVSRFMVIEPEQSKYTTQLQSQPDDPTRVPETYVFLPSLRRSLRLSSAARCSPILGTDWVQDDNAWNPPYFQVDFLGEKKVLMNIQDPDKAYSAKSYVGIADSKAGAFPGWPKAGSGHFEPRTVDIIDLKWISAMGPYCFSHRVFYVDRETWVPMMIDEYDNEGKLWKMGWNKYAPVRFHGEPFLFLDGYSAPQMIDYQNSHTTIGWSTEPTIDEQVPPAYRDVPALSSPGGLDRILQ